MTSTLRAKMDGMNMGSVGVDERAAGVFLGPDPYRELELYLEKVNAEIGEVFDNWCPIETKVDIPNKTEKAYKEIKFRKKFLSDSEYCKKEKSCNVELNFNGNGICDDLSFVNGNKKTQKHQYEKRKHEDDDFYDKFMTEFNEIVAKRLTDLTANESSDMTCYNPVINVSDSEPDYDEVFSDSENNTEYEEDGEKSDERDFKQPQQIGNINKKIFAQPNDSRLYALLNHSRKPGGITNFLKKNKESLPSLDNKLPGDAILMKVASLPDTDFFKSNSEEHLEERRNTDPELPKNLDQLINAAREPLLIERVIPHSACASPLFSKRDDIRAYNGLENTIFKSKSSDCILRQEALNIANENTNSHDQLTDINSNDPVSKTMNISKPMMYQLPSGNYIKDAETQTHGTPPLSRSSSCTWASECSSSIFNTGSTNASVTDEETAAVDDDNRSTSSSGVEAAERANGDESGIGTASPPPNKRKEDCKGDKKLSKCKRKEMWGHQQNSQTKLQDHPKYYKATNNEIWIRHENVTTQTVDDKESENIASDHTANTEDTSSNENLLMEESSMSENSLRRTLLSKKLNNSSSGIDSSMNDDLDSSGLSLSTNNTKMCGKITRPGYLNLRVENAPLAEGESLVSSTDCLDEPRSFRSFLGPYANDWERPSPTSASLKLSVTPMAELSLDLGGKCASVPALLKKNSLENAQGNLGDFEDDIDTVLYHRLAQSEKQIAEIEAVEACKWLRAAGFPQYAQMYEDMQFPINVSGVQNDHPFLDQDSLQSLFRRLAALNKCADMKVEHQHTTKHTNEDSDEENQCALSENWQYERKSRRWSRVVDINPQAQQRLQAIADRAIAEQNARDKAHGQTTEPTPDLLTVPGQELENSGNDEQPASRFRRTGSERLRDRAKDLLRRVESIKSRRRRRQNRDGVVISSPIDVLGMDQKMKDLNCIDITNTANLRFIDFPSSPTLYPSSPARSNPTSPMTTMPPSPMTSALPSFAGQNKLSPLPFGDDSSSYCSDASQSSAPKHHRSSTRSKLGNRARKFLQRNIKQDDSGALSDSECQPSSWRHHYFKDANSNDTKLVMVEPPSPIDDSSKTLSSISPPCTPKLRARSRSPAHRQTTRTGSLNLGKESQRFRDKSFKRGKSASRSELSGSQDSGGSHSHDEAEDKVQIEVSTKQKNNVQRWHSFHRSSSVGSRPSSNAVISPPVAHSEGENIAIEPMAAMSCGQLQVLRKLALLKLTACMERYCPTHRTGWNWELPKFIRKIKAPDYKDKTVFGVPLLVSLQRTGHALPKPIQTALRWLRNNALDQVGIFRKAGVRSRTLRLRQMAENANNTGHNTSMLPPPSTLAPYDEQQAHDVADMVKQYFRELPDALLTNKLSETFIAIFQHVPPPMREDAVQCALLLLPEEHREALQVVLAFLQQVADHSATNQMTASNLAVCLAPTLLRLHHHQQGQGNSNKEGNSNRSASASPRRKRGGTGGTANVIAPDPKELNESRAAHDCLLLLIKRHRELFTVSADTLQRCKFNSMEESIPVTLEELGSEFQQDWKGFQQACIQALLKEAREKSRGWISVTTHESHVDLCYRKVGDGHPLRLWRVTTEVEAPPSEVLHRILRERHIWDDSLLKWRVVERLNNQDEVFQYLTASMAPLQAKDYCVLRSWQSDLPRGGCCVVETSVSHAAAPVLLGGVRAVVLASRYLIEPAGKGRSRLMHLARVDTKGRTPEWYNKSYGHLCALYLARIRASFKHNADGPESNV